MNSRIPAISTRQMVEVDRLMIEKYGVLLIQMMENAGRNLAELSRRLLGGDLHTRQVVVLAGAGNNGGGGMAAARHLHNRGADVRLKLVARSSGLKDAPGRQFQILSAIGINPEEEPDLSQAHLIIDAMIGYGLEGDPIDPVAEWIERANASSRPVVALDVPSGLDAATGKPGSPCLRAAATLTLALPKTGLLAPQAREYVGDLHLADIGVPPELYASPTLDLVVEPIFTHDTIVHL